MKKIFMLLLLCGTVLQAAWSRWYAQRLRDEFGDPKSISAMVSNGPNNFIAVIVKDGTVAMAFRFGYYDMGNMAIKIRVKIDNNAPLELDAMGNGRDVITARTADNAMNWDTMIDQMIAGRRFRVVVADAYGKARLIDAPLNGFTAAYNQIR